MGNFIAKSPQKFDKKAFFDYNYVCFKNKR